MNNIEKFFHHTDYLCFSTRTGDLIIDRIYFQDKNKPPTIKNFGNYIELKSKISQNS